MSEQNTNKTNEFILQGFSEYPELQIPLFCVFFLIYLLTVLGNLLILTVIYMNPALHIPMYFFLCSLSCIDIFATSVSQPKLLSILLLGDNTISFSGCMVQLHCFMFLTCTEFVLLTAMAYDRYVAICNPLRYSVLLNTRVCVLLIITCCIVGFFDPLSHTLFISQLYFCRSYVINHFFCDTAMLIKLSCTDTFLIEIMTYISSFIVGLPAFSLLIVSYSCIISSILKISSTKGRKKAFSTCTSHLMVVIIFYGSVFITYVRPTSQYSSSQSRSFSIIYTAMIPLINPFIYTLRNKDIRKGICALQEGKLICCSNICQVVL